MSGLLHILKDIDVRTIKSVGFDRINEVGRVQLYAMTAGGKIHPYLSLDRDTYYKAQQVVVYSVELHNTVTEAILDYLGFRYLYTTAGYRDLYDSSIFQEYS